MSSARAFAFSLVFGVIAVAAGAARVPVTLTLDNLTQTYDGTQKSATCTTMPAGLTTTIVYSNIGWGKRRINAGSYGVTCSTVVASRTYKASGTLTILKADQTLSFAPLTDVTVGDAPFAAVASATSGLQVYLTSLTPAICTVTGNIVTAIGAGSCAIEASQPGDGNYNAAANATQSFTVAPSTSTPPTDHHEVVAYDSTLQGDWNIALWEDADHPVLANPDAPAPGRPGNALEVQFSANGWGAFGLANMKDWNTIHYMYLNEFTTIDFDIYVEPDSTGLHNLQFLLDDGGYSSDPPLVSYIPGWDPAHPENSFSQWLHVSIDLTQIGATIPRFSRFLLWNGDGTGSQPHFHVADVRLGWVDDTTPPVITLESAAPGLTSDTFTLAFSTDAATTYDVDYGVGDYGMRVQGNADDWAQQHTAVLTGLARGYTYQYRITARDHHTDPFAPPTPGTLEGTFATPPVSTAPPVISTFTATPSSIAAGDSSRLTWSVADYDTLAIDQGVGVVTQLSGTAGVFVSPPSTLTYTLIASNAAGTSTSSVTVDVHAVPVITLFAASPATIDLNGSTRLMWDVDAFDTLTIDHGIGTVSAIPGVLGVDVSPAETTTYVLTASNAYGTVRQTATVTIAAQPTHPIWTMGYYVGYQSGLQPPDKVDYSAMTHILLGAALPRIDGTFDTSFYIDPINGPAWAQDTVSRAHAAGTRAMLMLGGAGAVAGFQATRDPFIRAAFVSNLKSFVDAIGFDGIDIDWEPLDPAADRDAIVALLQALQAPGALPRSTYLYTVPVGWNNANFNNMAHPFFGELATYVDRISTMSYGMVWFGDGWESWHSSALAGHTPSTPSSIDNTVQALRVAGVPDAKIGIGIGFYGTPYENGGWSGGRFVHLDPPAIAAYVTAPHQNTDRATSRYSDNQASFSNLMQYVFTPTAYRWDDIAKVPYLTFTTPRTVNIAGQVADLQTTYVTYDNEQSIAEKGSYTRRNNLGGVIIWTISQGYLAQWKTAGEVDPLMKAVQEAFGR